MKISKVNDNLARIEGNFITHFIESEIVCIFHADKMWANVS